MSILGFFIRFTIANLLVMAAAGIGMSLLGAKTGSSVGTPILLGLSYGFFYWYSSKNSRLVVGSEKWRLVFAALAGDILVNVVLVLPVVLANELPVKFLLIGFLVVIPLHFLLFIAVNYSVRKMMLKRHPEWAQAGDPV